MFDVLICDPDEVEFEMTALGLLYTAVSRATTLGDEDGLNSAIYFIGEHFKAERMTRLGLRKGSDTEQYKRVIDRRVWVRRLREQTRRSHFTKKQISSVLQWAESNTVSYPYLYNHIRKYVENKSQPTATTDFHIVGEDTTPEPTSKRRRL